MSTLKTFSKLMTIFRVSSFFKIVKQNHFVFLNLHLEINLYFMSYEKKSDFILLIMKTAIRHML